MNSEISSELTQQAVNTIKMLSAEMVQKANSGHPGMPLGCADIAFVVWSKFLKHCPDDPSWINRDRFVLSAGHGSALLYSLLHLSGYALSLEQLGQFRQWDSITPGHPEYGVTPGVETTAGPLGQGFVNGIGMAIAAKMMAARFNKEGRQLFDHTIYGICSDGDLMEGVTSEAASIAGHLGLDNIIYLYDDNRITIEGGTDISFSEDRGKRFEAYGWFVLEIDGHDHKQIEEAICKAQKEGERPSLIIARTHIAHGSAMQDTSASHGSPLGEEEIARIKKEIGWPAQPFYVPDEVRQLFEKRKKDLDGQYQADIAALEAARAEDPEFAERWDAIRQKRMPEKLEAELLKSVSGDTATRVSSGKALQAAAAALPGLCGGSADLAPSNKTFITGEAVISKGNFQGRNFHFGVREHAMASICNGMALYGGWIPYAGTFLVFSDYMRPAIRLAALMELQVIYVFTHDSIFVGEDGPTHQPVEHLAALRNIPGLVTLRPAEATETAAAWAVALRRTEGPTALCLSRQGLKTLDRTIYPPAEKVAKGAYVLSDCQGTPEILLIATGSEVQLALEVQAALAQEGTKVRVISMPSQELFEAQEDAYREAVLPANLTRRVVLEAAAPFGWDRYLSSEGIMIGVNGFGKSAPNKVLADQFGFTKEKVIEKIRTKFA